MSESRMNVRPVIDFFSDTLLDVTNCAYSHAAARWLCGDGAMRHFGVPSGLVTLPGLSIDAVNALYQKTCCAILPCAGTGPASLNVMPDASGGAYFFSQSMYFVVAKTAAGLFVPPPRETDAPTG